MSTKTAKQALAKFLNMDQREMMEYEYHHGQFPHTVIALEGAYYYAARHRNNPPDPDTYHWIEQFEKEVNGDGWRVFMAGAKEQVVPENAAEILELRLRVLRSVLSDAPDPSSEDFREKYLQWYSRAGFDYRRELRFCRGEEDPAKTLTH